MTDSEPKATEAAERDLVGQIIGKYEVVRLLGGGGMGRVYEGINKAIGKRVALKFIEKDGATADAIARFQREAQAASAVEEMPISSKSSTPRRGTDDGMPFIVMELLRGEDLGHRIRRLGRLDLGEALHITAQILRGLYRAHEVGIIHRDLKPDNVFLLDRDDGQIFAKIVDFGVSKITRRGEGRSTTITQEGTVLGTPVYMSPEQAQAQSDVDARSDLYSVGAILYECLSGRPPHSGGSYEQVIVNICMKDAEDVRVLNADVPENVARVIAKALSRDRDARYASARELLDDLIAESSGVLSGRSVSSSDVREGRRRRVRSFGPMARHRTRRRSAQCRPSRSSLRGFRGAAHAKSSRGRRSTRRSALARFSSAVARSCSSRGAADRARTSLPRGRCSSRSTTASVRARRPRRSTRRPQRKSSSRLPRRPTRPLP